MIILAILVALLIIMTIASLLTFVSDTHKLTVPLYEVPVDGSSTFTQIDATSVDLRLTVCVEDTVAHVTMMAQDWSGPVYSPGVVRVFNAIPGCNKYVFADIPLPADRDPEAAPCVEWTIAGAVVPADVNRPSEPFSTAPQCIGASPKLTPCTPEDNC